MKKLLFTVILISIAVLISCTSTNGESHNVDAMPRGLGSETQDFSDVIGKKWQLTEVWLNGENTGFNRSSFANQSFTEIFTLEFHEERISGTGAPNGYAAPYTLGEGQDISIMLLLSTMMAPLFAPEGLGEHDFFAYLHNTYKWELVNENLTLHSKTQDDREILLVFI